MRGGRPKDVSKQNANCGACWDTFVNSGNKAKGVDKKGQYDEFAICNPCRTARRESKNERMNKFTWATLKEIDASWGYIKKEGDIYTLAIASFAQSLPVSVEQQQKLIRVMEGHNNG